MSKVKNVVSCFLALVTTHFMRTSLFDVKIAGNNVIWMVLFIALFYIVNKVLKVKDKRAIIVACIVSVLFALFEMIGHSIDRYLDLREIIGNNLLLRNFIRFTGYFTIFYSVILMLYIDVFPKIKEFNCEKFKNLFSGKKSFFLFWVIIFSAWIPYFLTYAPGILTPDSIAQINMGLGFREITNHHPVFHTLLISIIMNIGELFGGYNQGVMIYSIIQMLIMSAIFSYSIYYMGKKNINIIIRIIVLLFYALYPVHAMYSITMWKDILFAGVMLLFTILMVEISTNKDKFLSSKLKNLLFILSILLVILFRNNAIYVIVLSIPFIIIAAKKYYKRLIVIFSICILFYMVLKGPIFSILNIKAGSTREALSIPLQHFARIEKYRGEDLSEEDKKRIHNFLPVDNLAELYNARISDPVKGNFNDSYFAENKIEFIKLWTTMCLRFPREAIEAFLCNSYGYWYPEGYKWVVSREIHDKPNDTIFIKSEPIIEGKMVKNIDKLIDNRDTPVLSMAFSVGFVFWIILIALGYVIYQKRYENLIIFVPVIILWITTLASPVHCEFRYVYSLFTCLPILVCFGLGLDKEKDDTKTK